ncbi:hypothetical protein [Flavisphingomonas formosensis]|uniref:hypothetical protein n=1 Tax=Flavisphingomonas formosensis TaxID=861534 RepID=UPI0012FC97ED|nr:hypothetical protein [Sphingomonas formosensis]
MAIDWGLAKLPADYTKIALDAYDQAYAARRQRINDQRTDQVYDARETANRAYVQAHPQDSARDTLLSAGDYDGLKQLDAMDDRQRAQAADDAEFTARLAPTLKQIDATADGGAARREAARAILKQRGMTDAEINATDFSDRSLDLHENAAMSIKDRLAERRQDAIDNKPITAADGAVLVRDPNGGYRAVYTPGSKAVTQVVTDPVTGDVRVVAVPAQPGAVSGGHLPTFGRIDESYVSTQTPEQMSGTDRASRNNNPGNLRWDGKSKWQGMTGVDENGFVKFDTIENGQRALGINISNQQRLHGLNTVADFITKYAPPKDHNDTAAYIATVARALGVGPNDRVDFTDPNVQRAMAQTITRVEGNGTPPNSGGAPAQYVSSGAPNGATIVNLGGSSGQVWQPATRNGIQGQVNTRTGEFKPLPGQKAQDANTRAQAVDAIDSALNTVDTLSKHPGLSAAVGSALDPHSWLSYNPLSGKSWAGSNAADFETQLDTFKSQAFLQSVQQMRGLGALSDAEGQKLSAAIGNLSTRQSEAQFRANLAIVKDTLARARARMRAMGATVQTASPVAQPAPSGTPRVGEIRRGYRYNGGDPSARSSWSPVQ